LLFYKVFTEIKQGLLQFDHEINQNFNGRHFIEYF